jgi:aryl-alcohol dehydrogenase-like predicted oxidoreductase
MIETLAFGNTGHVSTRTLFGAAALSRTEPADSESVLELLLEHGINHIDTAASYGRSEECVGAWMLRHRGTFFLATKTDQRTYAAAKAQFEQSLTRLRVPSVDLLQLHFLVEPDEWQTAMGPGGALEYAVEARSKGLTRFIGVTGHGVTVARMHLRSLERFPFDSVLLPYNYTMMQNPAYAADFERLLGVCAERNVAVQTIKSITLGPWDERARTFNTWYEPLSEQLDIDTAVHWVLGRPGIFLNTVGDVGLLPMVLDAAERAGPRPHDAAMQALVERRAMRPFFV